MSIIDIVIIAAALLSIAVGIFRGFIKEAISIAALLTAIWVALHFGHSAAGWLGDSMGSADFKVWAGRALVFIVVLAVGAVLGWGLSKIIRMSALSGTDRLLGAGFGLARAALLLGVFVLAGRYAGLNSSHWWFESALIPYGEQVADWIAVMAPRGMEILQQDELPLDLPLPNGDHSQP